MNEKDLNQLHWLNMEIKKQQQRLEELRSTSQAKSQVITGMPSGSGTSDNVAKYAVEVADIEAQIDLNIKKCWYKLREIERYIETIEDSEARMIVRLRHISNLKWVEIGEELCMDRRTVSRKYYKLLNVAHNAHDKVI